MYLFVDHLTVIDCSYLHPDHGIEGQSWICDVALEGALDEQSMVMDFGLVKKRIKRAIDDWVDHCLLVPTQAAELEQLEVADETAVRLQWRDNAARLWEHQSPRAALCLMEAEAVNAAVVTAYLQRELLSVVPDTVEAVHIRLHEERIDTPFYHYSHGLKKHNGHCQRIAHGHRSKLEIWRDGEPALDMMQQWCERWAHVYLISQEDIMHHDETQIHSGYHAPEGRFELIAPAECCDILPSDSTVECIAEHIFTTLKREHPAHHWRVKAYEGVQKGAMEAG